jgi:hypothetical protein
MTTPVHGIAGPAAAAASQPLSPEAQVALRQLADIAVPAPVPWMPHTIGWAVLGVLLLAALAWAVVAGARRWWANRYRRAALAELSRIEAMAATDPAAAVAALPPLLKRTVLAEGPREAVAGLSGKGWTFFLSAQGELGPLAALLDDNEYRAAPSSPAAVPPLLAACRRWIANHRVPA